jgi:hypothetical protein
VPRRRGSIVTLQVSCISLGLAELLSSGVSSSGCWRRSEIGLAA